MTGLVRKAMLFGVCGLLAAATALANVPDPAHSTIPKYILVVGTNPGGPHSAGTFTITIRDFSNNPISNCRVDLDFSACCDLRLCTVVVAGQTLKQCTPPVVGAVTSPTGTVTFTIVGGGLDPGTCTPAAGHTRITPGPGVGCVSISACGFPMGNATAVILDLNGALSGGNGNNGGDLSVLLQDVGAQAGGDTYRGRGDFTRGTQGNDPVVNGADVSSYLPLQGQSAAGVGSANGCPSNAYCAGTACAGGPCKNP
jgi:hypothetical protein